MDPIFNDPHTGRAGRWVRQIAGYRAFIPRPLPPDPPVEITRERSRLLSAAALALGRLDGATRLLPHPDLFVGMYVHREAVLSSQIEGTQASLADVLASEAEAAHDFPLDVEEVVNYIAAMNHGLERLSTFPLSLHLIREIHGVLMRGVRGQHQYPGEFRRTQNWIGSSGSTLASATFVPPPSHELMDHLGALEKFMHEDSFPPLMRAGLAHAQFEMIHPFLDGNGRVGRLLITFMLCQEGVLHRPLLYLSRYIKQHQAEYYERLQGVQREGRWEEWIDYFLRGVADTSHEAWRTAHAALALQQRHQRLIHGAGKASVSMLRVHDLLLTRPIVTVPFLSRELGLTFAGVNSIVRRLEQLGIVREVTGQRRNRRFVYADYLALFEDPRP